MADSKQKTVWDYLATQIKTTAVRDVFDIEQPESQKYPYAVMNFGTAEIDYSTYGDDTHTIPVTVILYHTNPEDLKQLMELIYVLFHSAARVAALGALNCAIRPVTRHTPHGDTSYNRKDVQVGFVFFDLDIRYTY